MMKKLQLPIEDIFGEYDDEFRRDILHRYNMSFPHSVELHFPDVLIDKMMQVQLIAKALKLSTVKFVLTLSESAIRPVAIPLDEQRQVIPISQYEEAGQRNTLNEFSLIFDWMSKSFQAQLIYSTSYCETVFLTERFKLEKLLEDGSHGA